MTRHDWLKLFDKSIFFEEKWDVFSPYLRYIRSTTYFAAVMNVLRDIYKIDSLTIESAIETSRIIANRVKKGIYEEVFSLCHIKACLTYVSYDMVDFFQNANLIPVPTVSELYPGSAGDVERLERRAGISIFSLDDYEKAIRILFEQYQASNLKAVKFASAYFRKLDFCIVEKSDAESGFNRIKDNLDCKDKLPQSEQELAAVKPLQDYLTHYIVKLAGEYGMAVIFHIGIHAWNYNWIDYCHASYLNNMFFLHPEVKFVLLHGGIPFIDEAVLLAKYFPNVYLNMTWMHIIDRQKSKEAIKRYVEMLPANKVMGFGGDYFFIENLYGHLKIAKENITSALYDLVDEGRITEDEAFDIAYLWLFENPKRFFGL